MQVLRWATLLAAALAAAQPASASTLELFGFGGRSPGMVGNGVATTGSFASVYINPAGLATVRRVRVAVGALYGRLNLEIDDDELDTDPPLGTIFGAAAPIEFGGALKDRVSLGFATFVPTQAIARARFPVTGQPVFAVLDSRSQIVALQFGLGATILPGLRAGVSILGLAGLGGDIFVSSDAAGRFTSRSEQTLIARFAPIVGVQYELPDQALDLGLVFRAESDATFKVNVENDLESELPLTVPPLNIGGVAQYDPLIVALEGNWQPQPRLSLALQVSYNRWSEYESPTLQPVPGMPPSPAPEFSDTFIPRASAEWRAADDGVVVDVRGGYAFVMSPAPEMDGRQSLLDNHRHVGSLGVGLAWPDSIPFTFDIWVQGHVLQSRTHEKDPSAFEPDEELPFDRIDTGGRVVVGGLVMGVDL